jgi:sterol desaturase/sphingolipid hydroxylase (fatty acid hydroxylase superfamily)
MHTFPILNKLHKKHHALSPVHTFGAYYNSFGEICFTGSVLGICLTQIGKLGLLETAIVSSIGTFFTIYEHTPSSFWGASDKGKRTKTLSRHEIHHSICSTSNYAQPFSGFMDYLFGTRYEDVIKRRELLFKKM